MNAKGKVQVQSIRLREEFLTPTSNARDIEVGVRHSTSRPLRLVRAHDKLVTESRDHTGNDCNNLKIHHQLLSHREEAKRNGISKYQEEIKGSIEKMLKLNKLPQLDLKKTKKGEYIVSLEDLSFILVTLITRTDKKTEQILELKRKLKAYKKKILDLDTALKENAEKLMTTRHDLPLHGREDALGTARNPNIETAKGIRSFYSTNQVAEKPCDVLGELQKLLKVKSQNELPQALKKVTHVLKAIPEMESFVKEVSGIVHQGSASARSPDGVLSALRLWAKERDECRRSLAVKKRPSKAPHGDKRSV